MAGSSSRIAFGILIVALILGAELRCYRLGGDELNRGEAAAWAAASAPTVRDVIASGRRIDPGKLGLYDVGLHGWIAICGDDVGAMRAPSAILGSLSILLVFLAVREILRSFESATGDSATGDSASDPSMREFAGAFAALLLACNLQMITWDRTARMYSPMLAAMLAQLYFFVRAHRYKGILNWVAVAIFTVIAVAFNYTSLFFFAAEGLWLAYLVTIGTAGNAAPQLLFVRPALALAAAAAMVVPLAAMSSGIEVHALHAGALKSIELQPPWWPFRAMQVLAGNAAFWPLLALSIFGVWFQRKQAPRAIGFIACWMVVPFGLDMIVSYAIAPFMLERYVLASLVAFLVLAAIGLASIQSEIARYAIAGLVVAQSLAHIHHHWRSPEDIQWREAAQFAAATVPSGEKVALMPPGEPQYVVHYYLTQQQRDVVVNSDASFDGTSRTWAFRCGREPIAIVQLELPREFLSRIQQCYPRRLKKFRQVEVLSR